MVRIYVVRKKVGFSINSEFQVNGIEIQTLQGNNTHVNLACVPPGLRSPTAGRGGVDISHRFMPYVVGINIESTHCTQND
jgi:hypothetical protein